MKLYKLTEDDIFARLDIACEHPDKITFMKDTGEFDGIDNIIVSKVSIMYMLLHHFHHNLDDIVKKYDFLMFHENSVYYESQKLVGNYDIRISRFQYLTAIAWNHFKYT